MHTRGKYIWSGMVIIVAVVCSATVLTNAMADLEPCVLPFSTNNTCVACFGDNGIVEKCDVADLSSKCFGAAPTGPMVYCIEYTYLCMGMKYRYTNVLDCESDEMNMTWRNGGCV